MPQGGIEPIRFDRFVIVNDGIARGWPRERRLGDRAAGEGVEQRRFPNAGPAHEHDDQERPIHVERLGLAAQVDGQSFQSGAIDRRERIAVGSIEPVSQTAFQSAQRRR